MRVAARVAAPVTTVTTVTPVTTITLALALAAAAWAQPPGGVRPLYRCEVAPFTGAMSPAGARAVLTVLSDGLGCSVLVYGVPDARRNPATDLEITDAPRHGNAMILGAGARYIADRGYTGPDAFALRGVARDADNVEHPLVVRVQVDVRAEAFDRAGSGQAAMLMPVMPVRVGNDVPVPEKTKDAGAIYPRDAIAARAQGVVVIDATIDADGKVIDTRVTRSVPYLDAAAVAAVRQWEYTPTVLDGRAVSVIMTVDVSFKMAPQLMTAPPDGPAPGNLPGPPARPGIAPPSSRAPVEPDIDSAFELLQRRQYDDAVKAFKAANDHRNQQCAVCYLGMARAYEALGAAKNVADACDKAMAVGGPVGADRTLLVQAHQLKSVALQDLSHGTDAKKLREAEDELRAASAIDPSANFLHFNLGLVLLREGRDEDGVAELKEELSLRPDSPLAARARLMLDNPRRAREAFAPDFSIVTLDRELLDLNALKGKVVLLDFWGTWCGPCVTSVPALRSLQKHFAKDAFVLLSVSSDSDDAVVRAFVEKNKMTWPQYWDRDRKVQQAFDVRAFPTYVVLDDEGVMRFRTTGGGLNATAGVEDAIKKALKKSKGKS